MLLPIAINDADIPAFSYSKSTPIPKARAHENGAKSTHPVPALQPDAGVEQSWQQQEQPWEGAKGWQLEGTWSADCQLNNFDSFNPNERIVLNLDFDFDTDLFDKF